MASTNLNWRPWLCLPLRGARGEKMHRHFVWGAKRSLWFYFRVRTAKWTWRNCPHPQCEGFFSLKNIHSTFLCRYCLHSHPQQQHGSFTPCLEPSIQDLDVQQNGTAQTLQTFHQKAGVLFPSVFPESISWLPENMKRHPWIHLSLEIFLPIPSRWSVKKNRLCRVLFLNSFFYQF